MSRISPLQRRRRLGEMGRHGKVADFGQLFVEAATGASGDIPCSTNQNYMAEPSVASLYITTPAPCHRESQHQRPATGRGECCLRDAKLQTMEIWNGESGHACVFHYRRVCPTITLSSTWAQCLDVRVLKAWTSWSIAIPPGIFWSRRTSCRYVRPSERLKIVKGKTKDIHLE